QTITPPPAVEEADAEAEEEEEDKVYTCPSCDEEHDNEDELLTCEWGRCKEQGCTDCFKTCDSCSKNLCDSHFYNCQCCDVIVLNNGRGIMDPNQSWGNPDLIRQLKVFERRQQRMEDATRPPTESPRKPKPEAKRQRRNTSKATLALAMVEIHLKGVYSQMELLTKAINDLKAQLG